MAVQQGYGKAAGADALVFAYDTGDTRNSYKGEPTTNVIADPKPLSGWTVSNSGTSAATITYSSDNGIPHMELSSVNVDGSYPRINMANLTSTITDGFSISFEAKSNISNVQLGLALYSVGSTKTTQYATLSTEWQRFEFENLTTGFTLDDGYLRIPSTTSGAVYYIRRIQVEQKTHATQFVNGTRSATQGLLDLTGNSTLDLANVSFDANAQVTWDGTNDYISMTGFTQPVDPNIYSVEAVVKLYAHNPGTNIGSVIVNNYSALYGWIFYLKGPFSYLGIRHHDGGSGGYDLVYGTAINLNKFYHMVATDDKTTVRLYINGIQVASRSSAAALNYSGQPLIGQFGGNNAVTNGDIPIVKIYNRALTASEVQSNFKNYRKRFEGLDYYYDNTTDGGRWIRFWWYTGVGWPGHETEALGHPFGTFDSSSHYGFQRLPEGLNKDSVELLAKDGDGNIYKWDFADTSGTAQSVWDSFTQGTQGVWANNGAFMPTVIAGAFHGAQQDSWQYRVSEGVVSFMLDDDTCDCYSTLNAGHAMCGASGWSQTYAQPDGAYLRYGVDTLNDGGCLGPIPTRRLELFYRLK